MFGTKKTTQKEASPMASLPSVPHQTLPTEQKRESKPVSTGTIDTLISETCRIEGNVFSEHSIKIDGEINGNINAKETVIIAKKGRVHGEINANVLVVFGKLIGNSSTKTIHIQENGHIEGKIETLSLQVEPSATYAGEVSMSGKSDKSAKNQSGAKTVASANNTVSAEKTLSESKTTPNSHKS